jgi:hypothetical protein
MKFFVNQKKGFMTNERELLILDKNKIPFYYRNNLNGKFKFNLPIGTYYSDTKLIELINPVFYTTPKLKNRYFFKEVPKKLKIIYAENPNKCSVDLDRGIIIFDNSFKEQPRFIKEFIKYHELGHYRYSGRGQESEKDCDNYSAYCMINKGYNPLQINVASKYSLGNNHLSIERKNNNFNYLQAFKQY